MPPPIAQPGLEIRVRDLSCAFDGRLVLDRVSLDVARGEFVAIVGGSGSGKTVLMRHILGHFHPESGQVFVADHESPGSPLRDVTTLDNDGLDRLRRHWAVVYQRNALFSGTVYENIALALREVKGMNDAQIRPIAVSVLEAVGLNPDALMEVDRDNLSGGMAKRVAIARALALNPLLLFYDEPTTGLDPDLAKQIQSLMQEIQLRPVDQNQPRTTLVITHDKDLLFRLRPRIIMLSAGRVGFDGPFDDFLNSDNPRIKPYVERMDTLQRRQISA